MHYHTTFCFIVISFVATSLASEYDCGKLRIAEDSHESLDWTEIEGEESFTRISHTAELHAASSNIVIIGGIEIEATQPVTDFPILVFDFKANQFTSPQEEILSSTAPANNAVYDDVFVSPASRTDHASFTSNANNAIFVFGGRQQEFLNDLWRLCLKEGTSKAVWDELVPEVKEEDNPDGYPERRTGHSFTPISSNDSHIGGIVFGGLNEDYIELNDVYLALITRYSGDDCSKRSPAVSWHALNISNSSALPSPRAFHSAMATSINFKTNAASCLIMYGGKSSATDRGIFSDLWKLCPGPDTSELPIERQAYIWELLSPSDPTPGPRFGTHFVYIDDGRITLAGGSSVFPNDFLDDVWELNTNATQWIQLRQTSLYKSRRRDHSLTYDPASSKLVIFGGKDRYVVITTRIEVTTYVAPYCLAGSKIVFCDGKYKCLPCDAGSYFNVGANECQLCSAGYYSGVGAIACTKCPAGTYSSEVGKTDDSSCTPCPNGTASTIDGATTEDVCKPCEPGFFADSLGSTACKSCAAGMFSDSSASSSCTECSAGFWSHGGSDACLSCTPGTYSPESLLASRDRCWPCPKGFYSLSEATVCTACPINTYNDVTQASDGVASCRPCPARQYTIGTGQISCVYCPPGSTFQLVQCQPCNPGSFSSVITNGLCLPCAENTYTSISGSISCEACPNGTITAASGAASIADCQSCDFGYHISEGKQSCQACEVGTTASTLPGTCDACPPGSYMPNKGSINTCIDCLANTFSSSAGSSVCHECTDNAYALDKWEGCMSCEESNNGAPSCPSGRNGKVCSDLGMCVYGGCECYEGWTGGDCSERSPISTIMTSSVLYFDHSHPIVVDKVDGDTASMQTTITIRRDGDPDVPLEAVVSLKRSNITVLPSDLPINVALPRGEIQIELQLALENISPTDRCREVVLQLVDVDDSLATSAVSVELDNQVTLYIDDGNGPLGGIERSTKQPYRIDLPGIPTVDIALDYIAPTEVTMMAVTMLETQASISDIPFEMTFVLDGTLPDAKSCCSLLPAVIAYLQSTFDSHGGIFFSTVDTMKTKITFHEDLLSYFSRADEILLDGSNEATMTWSHLTDSLQAGFSEDENSYRRHLLVIFESDALVEDIAGQRQTAEALHNKSAFAFILSVGESKLDLVDEFVMATISAENWGTLPRTVATAVKAFKHEHIDILQDNFNLVSNVDIVDDEQNVAALPSVILSLTAIPRSVSSAMIVIGLPGLISIQVIVSSPPPACSTVNPVLPPFESHETGWLRNWHLLSEDEVIRSWETASDPSASIALHEDTSLLRTKRTAVLQLRGSDTSSILLRKRIDSPWLQQGLPVILRGYVRRQQPAIEVDAPSCALTLATGIEMVHASSVHFQSKTTQSSWEYGWTRLELQEDIESIFVTLICTSSSTETEVDVALLGLFPDPAYACECPQGHYHDTTRDSMCVRCPGGSLCVAGMKNVCPSGYFSFGEAHICEACRSGAICIDGHIGMCQSGTFASADGIQCEICPAGYSCRNGKKFICLPGTFAPVGSSECESCPPGSMSINSGSSSCGLCSADTTSEYQRDHCSSCLLGEVTTSHGQHPCQSLTIIEMSL